MRFSKLLVPVDFSRHSHAAAAIALQLVEEDGTVLLLHAEPVPGVASVTVEPFYISPTLWTRSQLRHTDEVRAALGKLEQSLLEEPGPGESAGRRRAVLEDRVVWGEAAPAIVRHAAGWQADLIVMGSHGLAGAARFLFGSVAEEVSHAVSCPVLVISARPDGSVPALPFSRVLVGVDHSPNARALALTGGQMVRPGGLVELVHVWRDPYTQGHYTGLSDGSAPGPAAVEAERAAEVARLEALAADIDLPDVTLRCYVESGMPQHALLQRASEMRADLLVLGTHPVHSLTETLIGTIADRVLQGADIPVLLVPGGATPAAETQPPNLDSVREEGTMRSPPMDA
jgi:nucleotide-binding universal stress UspA family protein